MAIVTPTPITRLLRIKTPIIAAPMAGASGGALAARVSRAGGFGFMAAGYDNADSFRKELELAGSILHDGSKSSASDDPLAIGVGFIGWTLDQDVEKAEELLSIALEARVAAIWFAFGSDLGKWVRFVRAADNRRPEPRKTVIFILTNSLQEARKAIREWDADVLVAQGIEAGGHGHGAAPPLLELVPKILEELSAEESGKPCPPVIAAGGLSTGAQIAALLTLGAAGVALGTRFLLTPEASYTDAQKAALVIANGSSTIRTPAFDVLRGTLGWPAGIDGRALKNKIVERFESGEDVENLRQLFRKATLEQDASGMLVWAGAGIGLVREIKPAEQVLVHLHREMVDCLKKAKSLTDSFSIPDTILQDYTEPY